MSLIAIALVNGILMAALLSALAYVCTIPFRLERRAGDGEARALV